MPIAGRPRRAEQDSASVASGGDPGAGCGALSLRSHVRAFAVGSPKGPLLRAPARPIGEPSDKADRPESPVPSGFRRNGLICFVAQLANSTNYSLRRDASHLKPLRPKRDSCGTCSEVPKPLVIISIARKGQVAGGLFNRIACRATALHR